MERLPIELITSIIELLDASSRALLARCSRRLYEIVLPHLYQNVSFHDNRDFWDTEFPSFVHTIARRPDLGAIVRTLVLQWWLTEADDGWSHYGVYDKDLFKGLVREIEHPEFNEKASMWDKALEDRLQDAYLPLILPRFTNLRCLSIVFPFECRFFLSAVTAGAMEGSPLYPIFPQLEELFFTWSDTQDGVETSYANAFFSLPSMKKICGKRALSDYERLDELEVKKRCSNVTEIDLIESCITDGLRDWIEQCRALKSLRVVQGGATVSLDGFYEPGPFREMLALHKSTLERVWLSCPVMQMVELADRPDEWVGSFADFEALRVLHVRLQNLVGVDATQKTPLRELGDHIPRSLEVLCISECHEETFGWLPTQIERMIRNGQAPVLRTLVIGEYNAEEMSRSEEKFRGIRETCEGAGIELKLFDTEYMEKIWPYYERPEWNY